MLPHLHRGAFGCLGYPGTHRKAANVISIFENLAPLKQLLCLPGVQNESANPERGIEGRFYKCNCSQATIFTYPIYSINRSGRLFNFESMGMGAYSRVGAYNFPNIFSKQGHFKRIAKQGTTSLFRFNKTKQSAKAIIKKA